MADLDDRDSAWENDDDDMTDDAGEESSSAESCEDVDGEDTQQSADGDSVDSSSADPKAIPDAVISDDDKPKTADELAEDRLRQKEETERQRELDRIVQENRERQKQSEGGAEARLDPSSLVGSVLKTYGDIEISDPESESGKSKLSAWAEKYPGILEAAAMFANVFSEQSVAPIQESLSRQETQQQANRILADLTSRHGIADAPTLLRSDGFWKFVDTLSPRVAALADSNDAEDIAVVAKMYQERNGGAAATPTADPAVQQAKGKQKAEALRQKRLHGSSLRSKPDSADAGNMTAEEQRNAAWADDDDGDDDL